MTKDEFLAEHRKGLDRMENIISAISFLLSFGIIFVIAFWVIPTDLTTATGGLLAFAKGAVAVLVALFVGEKLDFRLHRYYCLSKGYLRRFEKLDRFIDALDENTP